MNNTTVQYGIYVMRFIIRYKIAISVLANYNSVLNTDSLLTFTPWGFNRANNTSTKIRIVSCSNNVWSKSICSYFG